MKVMSFETKSSMSKAPAPAFIARALAACMLDAVRRKAESSVASCGADTGRSGGGDG
jgi:hypothetical protein